MKRLADQHPIKRIAMVHWKAEKIMERGLFQGQTADLMLLPTIANVSRPLALEAAVSRVDASRESPIQRQR
jgi:hypothetical protein